MGILALIGIAGGLAVIVCILFAIWVGVSWTLIKVFATAMLVMLLMNSLIKAIDE